MPCEARPEFKSDIAFKIKTAWQTGLLGMERLTQNQSNEGANVTTLTFNFFGKQQW